MKHSFAIACLLAAAALTACTDIKIHTIDNPDQYSNVYIPQAASNPNTKDVAFDATEPVKFPINIFLGGMNAAASDITAELEIQPELFTQFNESYAASSVQIPEGSYSMDKTSVTINAGEYKSDIAYVTVDVTKLPKGTEYVLPVTIKTCTVENVKASLSVAYFQIKVQKELKPQTEDVVLRFGEPAHGCIFHGAGTDIVFIDEDRNCNLYVYKADSNGNYAQDGEARGEAWIVDGHAFETVCVEPYTMCFRYQDTYQEFSFFGDYVSWQGAIIGPAGWAEMKRLFLYSNKTLFAVAADNSLRHYQYYEVPEYMTNHWLLVYEGVMVDNTEDWSQYKLLCCGDKILGVARDGQMYSWDINCDEPVEGGALDITVGEKTALTSGWNKYDHLFEVQGWIMAVDQEGDVHKLAVPQPTE